MAGGIQSPEKELRFTRSGQAVIFWLTSAVLTAVALTIAVTSVYREINPELPHPAWSLLPLLAAVAAVSLAIRLTRHAYVILSPLGIEVFPFYRPMDGMRLILWQEVHEAEVDAKRMMLTLHHDAEKSSGVHITLRPIRAERRELLLKALAGRIERTRF